MRGRVVENSMRCCCRVEAIVTVMAYCIPYRERGAW